MVDGVSPGVMPCRNVCGGTSGMLRSSASASNCTISRPCCAVTRASVFGVMSKVTATLVGAGIDARDDARDAQVADDQQARRAAQIEPDVERRRQRARQEVRRHEPACRHAAAAAPAA